MGTLEDQVACFWVGGWKGVREGDWVYKPMWVVVKIMILFWVLNIVRHNYLGDPQGDHNFDNHPCGSVFVHMFEMGYACCSEMCYERPVMFAPGAFESTA